MKKILKRIGVAVGAVIVLGLGALLYIGMSDIPSYETEAIDFQAERSPAAIARGKKLVLMLCVNCHLNRETGKLTGKRVLDAPPEFGEIYAPNITQDRKYGIGDWTDAELLYLLRTGIKKDGQYAPPYMPKFPTMADEDLNAVIAFLRSNDPMVTAASIPDTPSAPSFLTKLLCRVAFKPFPMPTAPIPLPDTNNLVELGAYLAHNLDCFSCHSADFATNNYLNPRRSKGYFAGGNKTFDEQGRVKRTPNLTPDKETGIGNWTAEEFINAVKYGIVKDGPALTYPMMPYVHLTDREAGAIFAYLQTIPPIKNKVERTVYE